MYHIYMDTHVHPLSNQPSNPPRTRPPCPCPCAQLMVGEIGNSRVLLELQFARSLPNHHRVAHAGPAGTWPPHGQHGHQGAEELHLLQAHDRLLVIAEAAEAAERGGGGTAMVGDGSSENAMGTNDLIVAHVIPPQPYVAAHWPLQHAAISANGCDIAVAARRGLALYHRATDKCAGRWGGWGMGGRGAPGNRGCLPRASLLGGMAAGRNGCCWGEWLLGAWGKGGRHGRALAVRTCCGPPSVAAVGLWGHNMLPKLLRQTAGSLVQG